CSEKSVPVTLKYDKYDDNDKFAQVEQASMQAAGFHVTLDSLTVSDWDKVVSQPLNKTNTQATTDGEDGIPGGHFYLTQEFACNAPYNVSQWCNAQFNRVAAKGDVTFNPQKANQLYAQAQRILLNDAPVVPTHVDNQDYLVKPQVHGLISVPVYWDIVPKGLDWANVTVGK
ncbi:MAG TPA: hypothetical protein VJY65_03585, partial [Chloroflexota bacterium]|nr:hypothetical protein [Chloroflexota bacterium]